MAVGLESRVPLLDDRVFEFAWRIPLAFKIREGRGKWILLPGSLPPCASGAERATQNGLWVPIDAWSRGALREWAEALLDAGRLKRQGFFHTDAVRTKGKEHLSGVRNWQYLLWGVLMFQAWLDRRSPHFVGTTRALPTASVRRNAHKALRGYYSLLTARGHVLETRVRLMMSGRLARIFSPRKRSRRRTTITWEAGVRDAQGLLDGVLPPQRGGPCRRTHRRWRSRHPPAPVGRLRRESEVLGPRPGRDDQRRGYSGRHRRSARRRSPSSASATRSETVSGPKCWGRRPPCNRPGKEPRIRDRQCRGQAPLARPSRGEGPSRPTRMPRSTPEPS
jgi:hypothetical protein